MMPALDMQGLVFKTGSSLYAVCRAASLVPPEVLRHCQFWCDTVYSERRATPEQKVITAA